MESPLPAARLDEARATIEEMLPGTRGFDGCLGITVHVDQQAPTRLMFVEHWVSRERYDAYCAWREKRADPRIPSLIPNPTIRYFDGLDD